MHLQDYMKYPDMACRMGFVPQFRWNSRPAEIISHVKVKKVIFVLGTVFLVYQNIGELVHWQLVGRKAEDTASFVAELSEATGALMLTSIGICNIWALTHYRSEINEVLTELEKLYPRPREMHYRRQHYFKLANRLMKYEFIFYVAFCAYYNGAPLLGLLYEYLMDEKEMRYKLQINTWYPWRTHGSALGYSLGFLCTVLSSIEGVAFSVATHHILCIVTYNLKLHYDSLSEQLLALDSRQPDAHQTLRKLIAYHCQILNLGDKVNHILNFSFLAALICATIAICMTSVAVLLLDLASAFKYINGLAAFVVYNFVICYLGTEVTIALGRAVVIPNQMQLEDFMTYPDWVCRMALLPRYEWKGRQSLPEHYSLAKRLLLAVGILHLVYHNIGCIMYGYHVDGASKDSIRYVAELATVGSMLGFTIVGTLNLWKLLYFKPQIEEMLGDFEELFKHAKVNSHRPKKYYEAYSRFIKGLVIAFSSTIVYYDSLPLTLMLWQHFMTESKELSYEIQSSTWYPWQVQGSVLGFSAAWILQTFSCQLLMASLMLSQYLVSFCGTQLEIHFDGLARQLEAIDARHPTAKDQLRYLVTYQSHLFQVADKVNRIFNFTFCVSLSIATMGMCFLGFSMTMFEFGEAVKHLFGLNIFMIYNFTMCRDGTHLTFAAVITTGHMQLEDFMKYPDWVGRMALLPRFEWKGRTSIGEERNIVKDILLVLGAIQLVYHNFGIMLYGLHIDGSSKDPLFYLTEWAAVVSMLGFTIVGTFNLWLLIYKKPQIEHIFEHFEELFNYAKQKEYRIQQYYEPYTRYLRNMVVFYSTVFVYYNSLPLIFLLWEYLLTESREFTYRAQSPTWYPWRTKGSIFGFSAAYTQQSVSGQILMATNVLTQALVHFFGTQLEIHFDGLANQLEAIDARSSRAKDQLRFLVAYQNRLFKLADSVNRMFEFTFFVGLSTSTLSLAFLLICMTSFDLGTALKHFFGLLLMLLYSFSMCKNGTHLTFSVRLVKAVVIPGHMQMEDFMMYPDWVGRMALLPRFKWKGRSSTGEHRSIVKDILLVFGAIQLVYHNFGIMLYGLHIDGSSKDTLFYLAEWAAVVSMMGFTIVGTLNLWLLLYNKPQIEAIFKDFEELFKYAKQKEYRTHQYYEAYTLYLRNLVVFYSTAIVYYNSLPFILLLWEHFLTESRQLTFRVQSTTWYPWRTNGSVLGFGAAYIQQAASCQIFMATIVLVQFLVSFFGTQLEIHFDGLASQLEAIDARSPRAKDQLRSLIAYQICLFKLADSVNRMFDFTFFVGLSTSTLCLGFLAICMTTFQLGPAIKHFFGLLIMLLYSYSMCRNGTHLSLAFQNFMRYTDIACHYALMRRFEWKGRESPRQRQILIQKLIFIMACINLHLFNISLCVYGYQLDRNSMDLSTYVAEISDTGSMLGFTVLGTLNMFVLLMYRPQIEELLAGLQNIFDQHGKYNHNTRYYLEKSTLLMKKFTVIYIAANVYYNIVPPLTMIYETLSESQELSYRIQTSSWYPWKIVGSLPGFCASYISQIFSSAQNIGFMMANQFLINVCTAQLELHFDVLVKQLENLDARDSRAKEKLKALILYHQTLLQLANIINRIFNFTFLVSLSTSTIAIFSMVFNLTTLNFTTAIKYSLGIGLFMIYTFSICHNGTQVTLASGKVMPAAFYNNWYEGDLAYRKMLIILMMRSTKPYMWRTYKLAPVSITTYMATLKFSYQMFTCVRSLK